MPDFALCTLHQRSKRRCVRVKSFANAGPKHPFITTGGNCMATVSSPLHPARIHRRRWRACRGRAVVGRVRGAAETSPIWPRSPERQDEDCVSSEELEGRDCGPMDRYELVWKRGRAGAAQAPREVIAALVLLAEGLCAIRYPPGARKLAGARHTWRVRPATTA